MSKDVALRNIRRQSCERWGHTEYSLNYHAPYLARRCGMRETDEHLVNRAFDGLQIDFTFGTNDGLVDWAAAGRVTNMGHASYAVDGSDQRTPSKSPFETPEAVWAFDAVGEYGLPDFDEQVAAYEQWVSDKRRASPGQLRPGGYYKTIVSGAIAAFGWDMLLLAASDVAKMEKVLDSFFQRTLFHMRAWAQTSAEAIIQHDDFVWTTGAFMHPDFYRKVIIPRYAELWKPIHEAGKQVLFCSDGNFTAFAADVIAAGADALIFEPCMDFRALAERYGKATCLVGSAVDCRDLTFGKWDKVRRDIDATFTALDACEGAIVAVGNHLPPNIPNDMLDRYFDYLLPRLAERKL